MTTTPEGLKKLAIAMGKEMRDDRIVIFLPERGDFDFLVWQPHKDASQCNQCEEWVLRQEFGVRTYPHNGGFTTFLEYVGSEIEYVGEGKTLLEAKASCFIQLAEHLQGE